MKLATCIDLETGRLIHHYELGQLDDAERDRFERHLLRCPFCAAEVEAMRPVASAMQANLETIRAGLAADGITFSRLQQELIPTRNISPGISGHVHWFWANVRDAIAQLSLQWKLLGGGAGMALAAAVIILLVLRPAAVSERYLPLLQFHALPFEGSSLVRGESAAAGQADFDAGMEAYGRSDYKQAAVNLRQAVAKSPNRGDWWLYLGITNFIQRDPRHAISALRRAETLTTGDNHLKAQWFLAQSYLLAGKKAAALPLLERLSAQNSNYSTEAAGLVERLRIE